LYHFAIFAKNFAFRNS